MKTLSNTIITEVSNRHKSVQKKTIYTISVTKQTVIIKDRWCCCAAEMARQWSELQEFWLFPWKLGSSKVAVRSCTGIDWLLQLQISVHTRTPSSSSSSCYAFSQKFTKPFHLICNTIPISLDFEWCSCWDVTSGWRPLLTITTGLLTGVHAKTDSKIGTISHGTLSAGRNGLLKKQTWISKCCIIYPQNKSPHRSVSMLVTLDVYKSFANTAAAINILRTELLQRTHFNEVSEKCMYSEN